MPSSHLILCRPLFLLPSIPPSTKVFSNESALRMRWPKYWSFSFSISPSNEHPRLISFRMDWLDLLAVQGTIDFCVSTNSLDYCRFSVNFEVRKCQSLTFISHFFWLFSVPFISISILGTASQFLKRKIKAGIFIGFA